MFYKIISSLIAVLFPTLPSQSLSSVNRPEAPRGSHPSSAQALRCFTSVLKQEQVQLLALIDTVNMPFAASQLRIEIHVLVLFSFLFQQRSVQIYSQLTSSKMQVYIQRQKPITKNHPWPIFQFCKIKYSSKARWRQIKEIAPTAALLLSLLTLTLSLNLSPST